METNNFDFLVLERCKAMIQQQLGWEESASWANSDFVKLSDIIHERTSVRLSSATLKRIWGKVRYENKPTITTLNTLAQYLGHADWREFKQLLLANKDLNEKAAIPHNENPNLTTPLKNISARWRYQKSIRMGVIVGLLVFVTIIITGIASSVEEKAKNYSFSSKKIVSEGVPNSVVFDYDASNSPVDSVIIQQSWDERLRTKVSKQDHQHTSIYYTPGFFKAKLVVNNEIVREHNLWITSNGWIALVKQNVIPVYFDKKDFAHGGILSLPISKLNEKNIPFQPETPWTSYYNVRDFGDIKTDNFEFATNVRSDFKQGSGICQRIQILLLTDGNVIIIPLSIKGCVSDLNLVFDDVVSGKTKDLSSFGADVSDWVNVRCEVKNKFGKIFINDSLAYQGAYNSSEKIVGMIFRFEGTGSIDDVSLTNSNGFNVLNNTF
jgi:hypothetical protein